ncbi:hypothetical protein [Bacteroides ihuae]|uniref:hypothetical protein n=1 Tax=Bacteroides ihuae TaxID=1852362 RepID=UPI0008DA601F|nr:hypothetical protein [Bacteroides ihuae]
MKQRNKIIGMMLLAICFFLQVAAQTNNQIIEKNDTLQYVFKLHGQTRRYNVVIEQKEGAMCWQWSIVRNLNLHTGCIVTSPQGLSNGTMLSFSQPNDGEQLTLKENETFGCISQAAFQSLMTEKSFIYNHTTYRLQKVEGSFEFGGTHYPLLKVVADIDGTELWIAKNSTLPLICKVSKSPLGIDWTINL